MPMARGFHLVLVMVLDLEMVLVRILVRGESGFWVIGGVVVGGGELTRFGGASWRVGLVEKWGILGLVKRVRIGEEVRRDKGFECL